MFLSVRKMKLNYIKPHTFKIEDHESRFFLFITNIFLIVKNTYLLASVHYKHVFIERSTTIHLM